MKYLDILIFRKNIMDIGHVILIVVILSTTIQSQEILDLPLQLKKQKSTIYTESGKIKGYIINEDNEQLYYVDKKSKINEALIFNCRNCSSIPIDKIVKLRKETDKDWIIASAAIIGLGSIIFSKGAKDVDKYRTEFSLGFWVLFGGKISMIFALMTKASDKSKFYSTGLRSLNLIDQKQTKEKIALKEFKERTSHRKQGYIFYIDNYQNEIRGYVVESTEEYVRVVGSRLLLDHPESINDRNSLVLSFSNIDYIQKASKRNLRL